MLKLRVAAQQTRHKDIMQKHDINHRKTEVYKTAKDYCKFGNNQTGGSGRSPAEELMQNGSQRGSDDQRQRNNGGRERQLKFGTHQFFLLFISTAKLS